MSKCTQGRHPVAQKRTDNLVADIPISPHWHHLPWTGLLDFKMRQWKEFDTICMPLFHKQCVLGRPSAQRSFWKKIWSSNNHKLCFTKCLLRQVSTALRYQSPSHRKYVLNTGTSGAYVWLNCICGYISPAEKSKSDNSQAYIHLIFINRDTQRLCWGWFP